MTHYPSVGELGNPIDWEPKAVLANHVLDAQLKCLRDKFVIYTVRRFGSNDKWLTYVGELLYTPAAEGQAEKYEVELHSRHNCLHFYLGLERYENATAQKFVIPAQGYEYSRLLALSVYQNWYISHIYQELQETKRVLSELKEFAGRAGAHNRIEDRVELIPGVPSLFNLEYWDTFESLSEFDNFVAKVRVKHSNGTPSTEAESALETLRMQMAQNINNPGWHKDATLHTITRRLLTIAICKLNKLGREAFEKVMLNFEVAPDDRISKALLKQIEEDKKTSNSHAGRGKEKFCSYCKTSGHTYPKCFKRMADERGKNVGGSAPKKV